MTAYYSRFMLNNTVAVRFEDGRSIEFGRSGEFSDDWSSEGPTLHGVEPLSVFTPVACADEYSVRAESYAELHGHEFLGERRARTASPGATTQALAPVRC